jgi:hypothetical protein
MKCSHLLPIFHDINCLQPTAPRLVRPAVDLESMKRVAMEEGAIIDDVVYPEGVMYRGRLVDVDCR